MAEYCPHTSLGFPESLDESTDYLVCDLAKSIGVDLKLYDIDRSHCVPKRPTPQGDQDHHAEGRWSYAGAVSSTKPRTIIVNMVSYKSKAALIKHQRQLKNKLQVILEDLTKQNADLLSPVSKMKD